MADIGNKVGYGKKGDIPQALTDQKIDAGDFIVTSDTKEFGFVKPDGTVIYPKNKDPVFESIEEAEEYISSNPDSIYVGQDIMIKSDDGNYYSYKIQESEEGNGFIITDSNSPEMIEKAKQEAIEESKEYADSIFTIVEF